VHHCGGHHIPIKSANSAFWMAVWKVGQWPLDNIILIYGSWRESIVASNCRTWLKNVSLNLFGNRIKERRDGYLPDAGGPCWLTQNVSMAVFWENIPKDSGRIVLLALSLQRLHKGYFFCFYVNTIPMCNCLYMYYVCVWNGVSERNKHHLNNECF